MQRSGLVARISAAGALTLAIGLPASSLAAPPAPRRAAIATADTEATRVGVEILRAGGNAVDAAVGAAVALAVVFPEAGNLGGGGFAMARIGEQTVALDFRETAPAAATADLFLDGQGNPRPGATDVGPLAAGVPGSPAGYFELHRRFGRLPWRRVVEPAIALARDGFALSPREAQTLAEERDDLSTYAETAARWMPEGRPLGAGTWLRQPELAATLVEYAERGADAFAHGRAGAAIDAASRAHGGILTRADLAAYRPVWREPLVFERFGWSFAAMPLPSSGGVIVAETLALLERRGWRELPPSSVDRVHLLVESLRRAYADRFDLGDPESTRARLADLLLPARLDARAAGIDLTRATPSKSVREPSPASPEGSDTTNVAVLDADGGAVALTTTLNDLYGGAFWVPGAGIFLNDEMDDFTTAPGRPNLFGLMQGDGNRVQPGRRPLSSMAPMILRDGDELLAIGGRGGSRIPSAVVQVLLNLLAGDGVAAAVARPRLHHQWLPDRLEAEPGALARPVVEELRRRGHEIVLPTSRAEVSLARRRASGEVEAAGDPRTAETAERVELPPAGRVPGGPVR